MWNAFVDDVKQRGVSAGRLAGTVTARQERRTRSGSRMAVVKLSDPTGQYEAVVFSDGLAAFGDMLEPGAALLLVVAADEREDGLSVRVQSVEALDQAALKLSRMMRIFVKEPAPIDSIRRILKEPGKSEVSVVLMLEDGRREVEVRLPQTFTVTPPIASAVKAIPGVIEVEYA
jgi:DNA polymerase-3 subunit alpha